MPPIVSEAVTSASSAPPIQPGTGYRYLSTNVLTGAVMGDWLPITGQSFSRALNSTGTGSCALNSTGDALTDSVNVAAVLARKAVLWVCRTARSSGTGSCSTGSIRASWTGRCR